MRPGLYTLIHLLWTLLTAGAASFILKGKYPANDTYILLGAFLLSALLSLGSYLLIFSSLQKRPAAFVSGVMLSLFLKMGLGFLSILGISWFFKDLAIPYAVAYLVSYFLYTSPEVIFLYRAAVKS